MKYSGAKCKLCRREGIKLFLKGDRCYSPKCPIERKGAVPPGQHGPRRVRTRYTDYGKQLREKQKAKRLYGVSERQFKNYYQKASKKSRNQGSLLLQFLERRLDNVFYRGGFVCSRSIARQIINHGLCLVDNKKVKIPSYQVKKGQIITLTTKGLELDSIKKSLTEKRKLPTWLERKAAVINVKNLPTREEIDSDIDDQLIVEFYSR